ncbi:protein white-like [Saccostrea echinata]|uniref:protein white-like n=1 Tax=Saccostrea echinata TaxID=191078 RepID=UPI002A811A23|nr:protein white-like [Saccostrea echinata]
MSSQMDSEKPVYYTNIDPELGFPQKDYEENYCSQVYPVTLSWKDCSVFSLPKRKLCCLLNKEDESPKQILTNVSGVIKPGRLTAVMGASGAGKSTLLNMLTFRNRGSLVIQGDIKVNGVIMEKEKMANLSAYVQQDDVFIGTMTVREHLIFRAILKMDGRTPKAEKLQRVEQVIQQLGLAKCADTVIGTPGKKKGISGGELKRLSFASELLTNPPLMFCDEVTSGLDSFMAQSVIQSLKTMVHTGHTIMCTVHQPSSEVFELFDEIILMAEGKVAFSGPVSHAIDFFKSVGHPCPGNYNPANHFILTLAIVPGYETECKGRVEKLCEFYDSSSASKRIDHFDVKMDPYERRMSQKLLEESIHSISSSGPSYFQQLRCVMWRSWITNIREPMLVKIKFIQTIIFALFMGLVYLKTSNNYNQEDIMNINGVIFLLIISFTYNNLFPVLNVFPKEIPVFLREHGAGLYRVDVYYFSKMAVEIPFLVINSTMVIAIVYWMSGLVHDLNAFVNAAIISVLASASSSSFGYAISAASPSVTIALSLGPLLMTPFLLFGGYFLNNGSVPDYFLWVKYASWFLYSNELMITNQWNGVSHISCGDVNSTVCIHTGKEIIHSLNYDENNFYFDLVMLSTIILTYRILAFLILLIKAKMSKC